MKLRIALGLAMIIGIGGILWADGLLQCRGSFKQSGVAVAVLWALISAVGFAEIARMAKSVGVKVLWVSGIAGTVALSTLPVWWGFVGFSARMSMPGIPAVTVIAIITMLVFLEQMIVHRVSDALRQVACTLLAVTYLGAGGAIIMSLRTENGLSVLVLFLAAVKFTDIGAYFTGSAIGRHKLIPWLSPGKTWEGLAGGLAVAAGLSMLLVRLSQGLEFGDGLGGSLNLEISMSMTQAAIFGVIVGAFGQFADLCESLLKRAANVKDSGALVPEFGGILDIIDSPLLSAPVALMVLYAFTLMR